MTPVLRDFLFQVFIYESSFPRSVKLVDTGGEFAPSFVVETAGAPLIMNILLN